MKEGHRNSLHCFILHVYISKKLLFFEEVRNLVTETRCKLLFAHAVADNDMRQPLSKKNPVHCLHLHFLKTFLSKQFLFYFVIYTLSFT